MQLTLKQTFEEIGSLTPNQIRDGYLIGPTLTSSNVQHLRHLALEEDLRRSKLTELYCKCPRCYGWHSQKNNVEFLCENCEHTFHLMHWDFTYLKQLPKVNSI